MSLINDMLREWNYVRAAFLVTSMFRYRCCLTRKAKKVPNDWQMLTYWVWSRNPKCAANIQQCSCRCTKRAPVPGFWVHSFFLLENDLCDLWTLHSALLSVDLFVFLYVYFTPCQVYLPMILWSLFLVSFLSLSPRSFVSYVQICFVFIFLTYFSCVFFFFFFYLWCMYSFSLSQSVCLSSL